MKHKKLNNFDMLLYLASEKSMDEELNDFLKSDVSDLQFDDRKRKKILKMIVKKRKAVSHYVKIALIACLICLSMAFTACVSIPQIRDIIYKVVVEWYDDHIRIYFGKGNETITEEKLEPIPDVKDESDESIETSSNITFPKSIERKAYPNYLPRKYITIVDLDNKTYYNVSYYTSAQNWAFTISQTIINDEFHLSDSENQTATETSINNNSGFIIMDKELPNYYNIIWRDTSYEYCIYGYFDSLQIALEIANNIKVD